MTVENKALVLDLLEWLAQEARPYGEVMDAWRTSCPRLPVWEDATDLGFVRTIQGARGSVVEITAPGRAYLQSERHFPIAFA